METGRFPDGDETLTNGDCRCRPCNCNSDLNLPTHSSAQHRHNASRYTP